MEELIKYTGVISIVLVIIGWLVIYKNARKIATRSENKSLIDDVIKILDDIETLSVAYWLSGRKNRIESEEFLLLFNAKLLTLNNRLGILKDRRVEISVVDLAKISECITFQCEDVDSFPNSVKRERVQTFLDTINASNEGLYKEFQNLHKPVY